MKSSTIRRLCTLAVFSAAGCMGCNAHAEVFYGGHTKGLPGDQVELTINARANTLLESIDIVPEYEDAAALLHFVSYTDTPALTDDATVTCNHEHNRCGYFYVTAKTFMADTELATLRFTIDPGAPVGPIAFDPGVVEGTKLVVLSTAQGFEVLAVPEPSSWILLLLGVPAVVYLVRRNPVQPAMDA